MSLYPVLKTDRLELRIPGKKDAQKLLEYFSKNKEHFAPWSQIRTQEFYTEKFWKKHLPYYKQEYLNNVSLRLIIFDKENTQGSILGEINFTHIIRGPFQACYLSYSLDEDSVGKGIMTEALQCSIDFMFQNMKLHRIMANYIPTNKRSGALLERLGFTVEGYAKDYLYIAGKWQDHVLTSLIAPDDVYE